MAKLQTTWAQRKALRAAWRQGGAHLMRHSNAGGAVRRMLLDMVKRGWLDKIGSWQLTAKGRELAARELGARPMPGDALRLHLADHGQDIVHLDVHLDRAHRATIFNCPQFWMWGDYDLVLGDNPLRTIKVGRRPRLELRPDRIANTKRSQRIELKYAIERVDFLGDGAKLAAEVEQGRAA